MSKNEKREVNSLIYLKRLKWIGIFGILFSIALIVYDIVKYSDWMSIVSLVVDVVLLLFSIYFIVKGVKLTKKELLALEKSKNSKKTKK